ncbi:acetyltransferase [Rhodococcus sp. MEB064]|nr:acetyltransferase [Rhodococcus sp. MEB064]
MVVVHHQATTRAPGARAVGARRPGHRVDLDGLRGLAIALVVVFHIWFGRVSGGVDVFLVLSGFFFTSMVLRRVERADGPVLRPLVVRTARRLYPAAVVVFGAVALWTLWDRPFTMWDATTRQLLASLAYVQNWELARTASDYAAADLSVSPLQHLWSMSVQVQFYVGVTAVVFLVAAACRRCGRRDLTTPVLVSVLAVAAAVSFAYAADIGRTHQGWAYYDTGARTWELAVGAIGGLVIGRVVLPAALRAAAAVVGLAALVGCGFLVDGAAQFPGPAALVPVGAAMLLVVAGAGAPESRAPAVTRALESRPLQFLGSIAYPLYLWHWPILIAVLGTGHSVTVVTGSAVVVVSIALAVATRSWVEEPVHRRGAGRGVLTALVTVGAIGLAAASATWQGYLDRATAQPTADVSSDDRYPGALALVDGVPVPDAPMRPTVLDADLDLPQSTLDGCIADMTQREVTSCVYGDPDATRTLALAGGSHAEHWLPALDRIGRDRGFAVVTYLKMGCPLDIGEPLLVDLPYPDCRDWSSDVLDILASDRPDWVFTTSTRPSPTEFGDVTPDAYLDVWARFSALALPVVAVRDTPWLSREGVPYRAADCLADGGDSESCGLPRSEVLSEIDPARAASLPFPSVVPVDFSDAVCGPDVCRVVEGNVLVYHDSHHLSATYVRSLVPVIDSTLGEVTGWW